MIQFLTICFQNAVFYRLQYPSYPILGCCLFYCHLVFLFNSLHIIFISCRFIAWNLNLLSITNWMELFIFLILCINKIFLKIIGYFYIHTYIIDHYNPSVRIIDLVSHNTYVVCVNFIHKWRELQFKVDSER